MHKDEGVSPARPRPNPRPSSPESPKPRTLALDDPVALSKAAHIYQLAMARAGLTLADLRAPEHVRAA